MVARSGTSATRKKKARSMKRKVRYHRSKKVLRDMLARKKKKVRACLSDLKQERKKLASKKRALTRARSALKKARKPK